LSPFGRTTSGYARSATAATGDVRTTALVTALQAGDVTAQHELWRTYSPLVIRLAQRTFGPHVDVDDVAQEIFAALFRDIRSLREPSSLRSFVFAIASNQIRRELRRKRARRLLERALFVYKPDPDVVGPSSSAALALRRLYALLERFRPLDRMCFILRHVEGHTNEDAATILDVSPTTVKRKAGAVAGRLSHHIQKDPFLSDFLPEQRTARDD
jgi:RNA polymerase sigma-70 factor (ECF subfamily)